MRAPPLRVLHVDPERGLAGGEAQVLALVGHLARAGVQQTVAVHPGGRLAAAVAALDVPTTPLRIRNHADVLAGLRLRGLLAQGRCDIVHFHTARAHAMSVFLGRRRATRRVVTRRMDYRLRGGPYARWLYNGGVDAVLAISEDVRRVLIADGVGAARIRVVPSGVDVARFDAATSMRAATRAALGVADEACCIVLVGALETRKGHAVLLDAVATLGDLPLAVRCAGSGGEADALATRTVALGLGDRVRFLGPVGDVAPLFAAADVAVLPSLAEGLGVAALEAMASGLPVIASRVGGLPEAVVDGETGILVPPGDPAALAGALRRLATDPVLAARWGAAGRARVAERFDARLMAEQTLDVYRALMEDLDGRRTQAS